MKDYSLNKYDKMDFILNYMIENDQIKIRYADNKTYTIPYTSHNEKKIIKKMKLQVLNSGKFEDEQKENVKKNIKSLIANIVILGLNILSIVYLDGGMISYIISIISAFTLEAYTCNIIKIKRALEDIEKNKLLINNEEEINKSIVENKNILNNVDKEVTEIIQSARDENNVINISSIENLKLKELKSLLEIILREKKLGFDSSIDDNEEKNSYDDKPYTLNMKIWKNNTYIPVLFFYIILY